MSRSQAWSGACLLALALPCCRASSAPSDAGPALVASASPAASASAAAIEASITLPPAATSAATVTAPTTLDGGLDVVEGCRLLRGPLRLSMKGPALLWSAGADPAARMDFRVIFNRDGAAARVSPVFAELVGPTTKPRDGAAKAGAGEAGAGEDREMPPATWPACSVAGRFVFCMDLGGSIRRTALSEEVQSVVAAGRRGSSIAAVALPGGHTLLAFLGDRKTSEGVVTQAFAVLDDRPAVLLSTEGSGATFVTLAPWKGGALALYVDARAALTPVHARGVGLAGSDGLALGQDAVIFVGEGAESWMTGAIAVGSGGPAFALLPTAKDLSQFGMAIVRIDDAPKDDMPVVWSSYPNGLSPAPIAATYGVAPIHVARVRPAGRAPGSARVLEIGQLAADGQFLARCEAAKSASFKHVAIEADRDGSLWLAYTSASGSWIEQRAAGP